MEELCCTVAFVQQRNGKAHRQNRRSPTVVEVDALVPSFASDEHETAFQSRMSHDFGYETVQTV